MKYLLSVIFLFPLWLLSQTGGVQGVVKSPQDLIPFANVGLAQESLTSSAVEPLWWAYINTGAGSLADGK